MKLRRIVHLRKFSKRSLKILAWTLSIFIGIILTFAAWLYFQEARVKEILIHELNKRLISEVKVSDVEFSILKSFPYTSIDFINPQAKGAHASDPEYLFKAKRISLHFNIMDIYYGKYDIKRIEVQDGFFDLKCYKDKDYNFHIWKKDSLSDADFRFSLKKIIGKNVKIRYRDMQAGYDYAILANQLTAKGNFDQSEQKIWIKCEYGDCLFNQQGLILLQNKKGKIDLSLKNQTDQKYCDILDGQFSINGLKFAAKGKVEYGKQSNLDIAIQGLQLSVSDFITSLPSQEQIYFSDYKSKGIFDFNLRINGDYHIDKGLSIAGSFNCKNAEITHTPSKTTISDINMQGTYGNGNERSLTSGRLHLKNFSGQLSSGKFSGQLRIQNFLQPTLSCETKIEADLEELNKFLGLKKYFLCSGKLNLALSYQNTFSSFDFSKIEKEDFLYSRCHGKVQITDFNFYTETPASYSLQSPNLSFEFTPENVNLQQTVLKVNRQEITLSADFTNIFPALFLKNQMLKVDADIKAKRLDIDLISPTKDNAKINKENDAASLLALPLILDKLTLSSHLSIDQVTYKGVNYTNLQTYITANPQNYKLAPFSIDAFDGSSKGIIDIRRLSPDRFLINIDAVNTGLNVKKVLETFNNFGQNQVTSEQISGILNNEMQVSAIYDLKLGIDLNSILLWTKINLSKGQLKNTEILKILAKFTGEKDLQSLNFADLNNIIEIKEAIISIPEMSVFSNALNLKISGEHHFNNNVNYLIKIELSEILSRRRKARNAKNRDEEFGIVQSDNTSVIVLPLRITGNLSNPHVEYDMRSAKKQLSEAQQKEKANVKQILKEEFSNLKNTENQTDKKAWKEQETGKFQINWEEEAPKTNGADTKSKSNTSQETKKESAKFKIEFDAE